MQLIIHFKPTVTTGILCFAMELIFSILFLLFIGFLYNSKHYCTILDSDVVSFISFWIFLVISNIYGYVDML